jgi:excisionase family DNA binding protein
LDIPDRENLTPAETALVLGVTVRTIRRWAEEERIPFWKTPGGCLRIPAAAVVEIMETRGEG